MVEAVARVLFWLALGEAVAWGWSVPLPGSVLGLIFFTCELLACRQAPASVSALADGVLPHLTVLFVPAGVGAIAHLDLLRADLIPILGAVLGGTLVTVAVTSASIELLVSLQRRREAQPGGDAYAPDL